MKYMFLLVILVSCNYKIEKQDTSLSGAPSEEMSQTVSYKQLHDEVLAPKCLSCHGNAGGINLESYPSTFQHIEIIKHAALQTKTMPKAPVSPLNKHQLEVLTAWCDAGGPEHPRNGGSNGDEGEEEPGQITFKKIKKEIIDLKCISCHTKGEHAEKVPFDSREEVMNSSLGLIVPGNPESSLIYTITEPGARDMMPPYPGTPLTPVQREMIKTWILGGAP